MGPVPTLGTIIKQSDKPRKGQMYTLLLDGGLAGAVVQW